MGAIYIKYQNKGFWMEDDFVVIISMYISRAFEIIGLSNLTGNLVHLYDNFDANRTGETTGFVGLLLQQYVLTTQDKNQFITVLNRAKILIQAASPELTIIQLNLLENEKDEAFRLVWSIPLQTQSLMNTIDIIVDLLNGVFADDNKTIHFIGYPVIPGAIVVKS